MTGLYEILIEGPTITAKNGWDLLIASYKFKITSFVLLRLPLELRYLKFGQLCFCSLTHNYHSSSGPRRRGLPCTHTSIVI